MMNEQKIPSYQEKSDSLLIQNNYLLIDSYNNDINCIIYYISPNKIKIILRKFNLNSKGWINNLQIKLFSIDNKDHEIIYVGSSSKHYKIINYKINLCIKEKIPKKISIPKNIYQTYSNNEYHNESHYNSVQTLMELNPSYNYYFYNDKECRLFIKDNFEESVLNAYDRLYPTAYKADLFRYCLMYIYGGLYIDHKYVLRKSFDDIINEEDKYLYCQDTKPELIFNSIIITVAKNEKIKVLINKIVDHVINKYYGLCPLHPTGPRLFCEIMKDNNISLYHKSNEKNKNYQSGKILIKSNNQLFLNTSYDGYYYNKNHRHELKNNYHNCYQQKCIYLNYKYVIKHYTFYLLTNKQKIIFQVILLNKNENEEYIQLIIQGINEKELKKNEKLIVLNTLNNHLCDYNLLDVYNKIIKLN